MSSVPYFTHTHFGLQVVSLHDNQQHERRGIYGYIAGSNFRTGGALFVGSLLHTHIRIPEQDSNLCHMMLCASQGCLLALEISQRLRSAWGASPTH